MNTKVKLLLLSLVFIGSIPTVSAGGVITDFTFGGTEGAGVVIGENSLHLTKVFTGRGPNDITDPIILIFTVGHSEAGSGSYDVTELIGNNTSRPFAHYHLGITEPASPNRVAFTNLESSTLEGATLDPSSVIQPFPFNPTGPRDLNFTGSLPEAISSEARFALSLLDPGVGNTYTFTITQTAAPIPEPEIYAMLLAGLGLLGYMAKRRAEKERRGRPLVG